MDRRTKWFKETATLLRNTVYIGTTVSLVQQFYPDLDRITVYCVWYPVGTLYKGRSKTLPKDNFASTVLMFALTLYFHFIFPF